ncbi:MAG TPA: GNAT family N-acetyltransferase [Dehalococcoidales bacterium]|nr:GNAT family N-acetyltransferase [Dehalococcoidales bacterium]
MISGDKVKLREKILADAANDYAWLVDAELAELDAAPLPTTTFPQYLADYTGDLRYPSTTRYQFAIETREGKHIGNCTYYGIDNDKGEAELGIMIGDRDYWDRGYGTDAVAALLDYVFGHTRLNRLYLKTLIYNTRAQKCFARCGFTPYGHLNKDGYSFILMELHRNQWEKRL